LMYTEQEMSRNWDRSRALLARARNSLAGGVSSPFRAQFPVPLYLAGGRGSRLTDVDGNEYIDYVLAWGPMILGYSHPAMVEAIRRQAEGPHSYGEQHELEIEVAERIQKMVPCAERVAFTSSGSEAVQLAHRLARAFTGRNLLLKFEGHYHGWLDGALVGYKPSANQLGPIEAPPSTLGSRGQVPNAAENTVVAPWNRLDLLEQILDRHQGKIAAIMMEPVLCNSGCLLPLPGYLEGVRDLAKKHGALLIFDEVITGFRMGPGGAQAHFGITPDLATFGKAVAAGLPLSVIAGRKDLMEQMFGGGVSFGGTFNGNPLSLAGANAALSELAKDNGAALARANALGKKLMDGICGLGRKHGVPLTVSGFGTAFALHFTPKPELIDYRDTLVDDRDRLRKFLALNLGEGVHSLPDGRFYTSVAHTEQDVAETLGAVDRALTALVATA
ncbi:MAG TPA: aspartate aminotransferase family protein, partial [Bryobacteraceae bacterium]|nr:aspartate aminotransferase family protein [Bryobacteraceae bacterium]